MPSNRLTEAESIKVKGKKSAQIDYHGTHAIRRRDYQNNKIGDNQ